MNRKIEEILDICVEKLSEGIPLEEILKEFPNYKDELKELLGIVENIKNSSLPSPSDKGLNYCLIKMGEVAQQEKRKSKKVGRFFPFRFLTWVKVLAYAGLIIFISWGIINISAESVPGDYLYPAKIITEKVKFLISFDTENKVELRLTFSEERMEELIQQLNKNKTFNPQLLQAMLDEASLALENITNLPEDKRKIYYSKLKYLTQYQKNTLEDIKPKVKLQQRKKVDWAINMCKMRMQKMHQMMRQDKSMNKMMDRMMNMME